MRFETYDECAPQSDLYHQWCQLATSPLERPEWLLSWWDAFGRDDRRCELTLVAMFDDRRLIALAPLYRRQACLRLLGDGQACTDHLGLLIGTNALLEHRRMLAWLIDEAEQLGWQTMDFESVDHRNVTSVAICELNQLHQRLSSTGSCSVSLPDDFEVYLAGLSKNHRKRCRRWKRAFFDNGKIQSFSTLQSTDFRQSLPWSYSDAFDALRELHYQRRRGIDGGAFRNPRFDAFLQSAFQQLAPLGMAEISGIQIAGAMQAVEFELHGPKVSYAYQSGLAGTGLAHDAGSLSLVNRVRTAIAKGQSRLDLMRGEEDYKFHWGVQIEPASRLRLWQANWTGQFARSTSLLCNLSKSLIRSVASMN